MASASTTILIALLLAAAFYSQSVAIENQVKRNVYGEKACGSACDYRCSEARLHHRCLKYCNICCGKCQCVPPGTAGNKEVCPCYNDMKNSRGGPKCP